MAKKIVQPVEVQASVKGDSSVKSFKAQIREAQQEALRLAAAFGETDARTLAAAQRVAELKDRMEDVNATIKGLHPDKFQAIANITGTLANGFAAAQGAAALLGGESEDLQKAMVRVQGAMALAQGIAGLKDLQFMFAAIKATVLTEIVPAFQTMGGALMATGVGAVIASIGAALAYFTTQASKARKEGEKIRSELQKANDNYAEMNQRLAEEIQGPSIGEEIQILRDRLKGKYKTEEEANIARLKEAAKYWREQAALEKAGSDKKLSYIMAAANADTEITKLELQAKLKAQEDAAAAADKNREEQKAKQIKAEQDSITRNVEMLKLEEDTLDNRLAIAQLNFEKQERQLKEQGFTEVQIQKMLNAELKRVKDSYYKEQAALDKQATDQAKADEDKAINDLLSARKKYYDQLELEAMQNSRNQDEIDKKLTDIKQVRLQNEITILKAYGRDTLELEKQLETEKANIRKTADELEDKARDERRKKNKEEAEARQRDIELGVNAAQSMLTLFDALTTNSNAKSEEQRKKEFERKKKFEMAAAIMSTISSAQAAYQSQMASAAVGDVTAPIRASIAAATAMAQGLARVAMISKQSYQASSPPSGGGGMSGGGAMRPSMPSTAAGLPGGSEMAGGAAKVFVTESDISATQGRVKALKAGSVI